MQDADSQQRCRGGGPFCHCPHRFGRETLLPPQGLDHERNDRICRCARVRMVPEDRVCNSPTRLGAVMVNGVDPNPVDRYAEHADE
jgi:hypothetical protein